MQLLDKKGFNNDIYIKKNIMAKFNNNDDDFNDEFGNEGEDFNRRWEEFNNMMNDREFKRDYNRFRSDLEELMRLISSRRRDGDSPLKFRFIPLNDPRMDDFRENLTNDFNIPEDEMDIEKGEDENGEWETKNWTSPDGSMSFTSFSRSSSFDDNTEVPDELAEFFGRMKERNTKKVNPEEVKKLKLAKLQKSLEYLVEQEKYEKAAEVKKMIDELNKPTEEKTEEN